ncbi:MAG: hypothetical protein ACRD2S_04320 [Terriglobales bacterium]
MSAARINNAELMAPPVALTIQRRSLIVGVIFAIIGIIFAFINPDQFFRSYLLGFMAWLGLTLGCMSFLMLHHLTGGKWGMVVRRPLEAAISTLPLLAVLFIPLIIGMRHVYVWTDAAAMAQDAHLKDLTHSYLTPTGFVWRGIVYFVIWMLLAWRLNKVSAEQDHPPVRNLSPRFRNIAGPGLVIYSFSMSFAVIDWVMSLTPPWISTIYAMIYLVGQFLSAVCFMVVVERIFFPYKPVSSYLKPKEVQDHGKLMLTFIMLWAYFSFSQLLIIWAGNLPDEITFYTRRFHHGWEYVGLFLIAFHFAVPFAILLSRSLKRDPRRLVWVAVWVIFMRYVDLYWFIEPNFHQQFYWHFLDAVVPVAIGGFWLSLFFRNVRRRPLLPQYDPHAIELLELVHD